MDYLVTFEDGSKAYLMHHGVLGMKWGVRNEETETRYERDNAADLLDEMTWGGVTDYRTEGRLKDWGRKTGMRYEDSIPDERLVLGTDTKFVSWGGDKKDIGNGPLYTTWKPEAENTYSVFGKTKYELAPKKDFHVASMKDSYDTYKSLVSDTSDTGQAFREDVFSRMLGGIASPEKVTAYATAAKMVPDEASAVSYKSFVDNQYRNSDATKMFFDRMSEQGHDGILDQHDISDYTKESPVIVLRPKESLTLSNTIQHSFTSSSKAYLMHYGVLGMKWGVRKDESAARIRRAHVASVTDVKLGSVPKSVKDTGRKRVNGLFEDFEREFQEADKQYNDALAASQRHADNEVELKRWGSELQGPKDPNNTLDNGRLQNILDLVKARDDAVSSNIEGEIPKIVGEHTFDDDMKKANPLKGAPGYTDNCACCSAATLLRQKGYDVVADVRGDDGTLNIASQMWFKGGQFKNVIDEVGGDDRSTIRSDYINSIGGESKSTDWSKVDRNVMEKWIVHDEPEGSSGMLHGQYDKEICDGGHSITYKIENGKVVCRDGQTGEKYDSFYDATKHFDPQQIQYMRTDDKEPNWSQLAAQRVVKYRNDYYD